MAEVKSEEVGFVGVVDAEGNPLLEFPHPVPESWIGTSLLPEGAKKAPDAAEPDADTDAADDKGGDPAPRGRRSA